MDVCKGGVPREREGGDGVDGEGDIGWIGKREETGSDVDSFDVNFVRDLGGEF